MACPNGHAQEELQQESKDLEFENTEQAHEVEVVEQKNILAVHDHVCEKCGYTKAEMREIGAWYSDEDSVVKMKCGKCGHVQQLEGKTT